MSGALVLIVAKSVLANRGLVLGFMGWCIDVQLQLDEGGENTQMSKHGKLVNLLMNLHFIEDSQRSVKEIRERIEYYEKRNLDLISKWSNGIPEWVQKEILDIDTKISELKWTIYDD